MPFSSSRLHAIVGASVRLRDESLSRLLASWQGPVKRSVDADPRQVLVDLDTPSLFGEPALWVLRGDEAWIRKHHEAFAPLAGTPAVAGVAILLLPAIDGRWQLGKALTAAKALHDADPPWTGLRPGEATTACRAWVAERLSVHKPGVRRPPLVAERLVGHLGEDADALLAAIDVLLIHADEEPIDPEQVERVVVGTAERPVWEFTGAVLAGNASRAIELLEAGQGMEPQMALAALINEIRKCLAALESDDDAEAGRRAGLKGRANLYHARRTAQTLGKGNLQRLLGGAILTQRQLRQAGTDHRLLVLQLVLHARMLTTAGKR